MQKTQGKTAAALPKIKRPPTKEYESRLGIRLDYSDTYFENDMLNNELESKIAYLHKEKYRLGVERDENLKEARKAAEDMQQLSEAIKRGNVCDSLSLVTGKLQNEDTEQHKQIEKKVSVEALCSEIRRINMHESDSEPDLDDTRTNSPDTHSSEKSKPINTLTMFALSLHKFRSNLSHSSSESKSHSDTNKLKQRTQSAKTVQRAFPRARFDRRPKFRRPLTVRQKPIKEGEVLEAADCMPVMVYGIHVRKGKPSRSRRELQEISKLEQREKFGGPDRDEKRKKKLEKWVKGDGMLEKRVRSFISDCDQFTKQDKQLAFPMHSPRRPRTTVF